MKKTRSSAKLVQRPVQPTRQFLPSRRTPEEVRKNAPPVGKRDVNMRFKEDILAELDQLCEVNQRSRQSVISVLVHEAYEEWDSDPTARI